MFLLVATNQSRSFQTLTSQQLSNNLGFAVFDENSASASGPEIPVLTPQPWTAPPAPRAKENELSAGPWNSGRVRSLKMDWGKKEKVCYKLITTSDPSDKCCGLFPLPGVCVYL